jgi:hypothetical protein
LTSISWASQKKGALVIRDQEKQALKIHSQSSELFDGNPEKNEQRQVFEFGKPTKKTKFKKVARRGLTHKSFY